MKKKESNWTKTLRKVGLVGIAILVIGLICIGGAIYMFMKLDIYMFLVLGILGVILFMVGIVLFAVGNTVAAAGRGARLVSFISGKPAPKTVKNPKYVENGTDALLFLTHPLSYASYKKQGGKVVKIGPSLFKKKKK